MIKKFNTLYARDSKGTILEWNIEVQSGSQVDIKTIYGEYKGAKALKWQRNIQGKNIGKSNETTPYFQAIAISESKIRLKIKKGYLTLDTANTLYKKDLEDNVQTPPSFTFKHITEDNRDSFLVLLEKIIPKERTDADGAIKPMKAQQYYRSKKNWIDPNREIWSDRKYYYLSNPYVQKEKNSIITKFPCMGQPKINGVRATIKEENKNIIIKSKEGKIYNIAHINTFLKNTLNIFDCNRILDGELYIHKELLQDIGSAINKPNLNTPRLKFILFDLAIEGTNIQRWNVIKELIKFILDKYLDCPIEIIKTVAIRNDKDAQKFTDICIEKGYEGAIFRQMKGIYAFGKRPQDMTKLKRIISSEFKIIDVIPQEKDQYKGNFVCITKEGLRFNVNPKGTNSFKEEVLENKQDYIGKNLQCSFYEWTKDLKPFHIIENTIRDYE